MSRKKKIHFFHWSVCTLYRPYHHFMNLKRKLAPPPPHWELVSPSCGNSDVAMSGDKVTSLRGVLSGGWHCVTTPDAGCFVIFLLDCYSDVFMNGLETKMLHWSRRHLKLLCAVGTFFLSNTNMVLWLSVRNISIFRWCQSGRVSGPSPFSSPPVTSLLAGRWQLPTRRRGDNPAAARLTLHLPPSLLGWETFSHTASRRPRPSRNARQRWRGLYLPSPPQSCCPAVTGPASGFRTNIQYKEAGHRIWKRFHSSVVVFCAPWNPEYVISQRLVLLRSRRWANVPAMRTASWDEPSIKSLLLAAALFLFSVFCLWGSGTRRLTSGSAVSWTGPWILCLSTLRYKSLHSLCEPPLYKKATLDRRKALWKGSLHYVNRDRDCLLLEKTRCASHHKGFNSFSCNKIWGR